MLLIEVIREMNVVKMMLSTITISIIMVSMAMSMFKALTRLMMVCVLASCGA